jgi:hypothetical protein
MMIAGVVYGLTLLVPFATSGRAQFHFDTTVAYVLVLALGMVGAGILLQFTRTAPFGSGMGLAVAVVADTSFIGSIAALTTSERAHGPGFWITGVAVILLTLACISLLRILRSTGRLGLRGGPAEAGWVAAAAIFGLVVAVGEGLPHRVASVTDIRGSLGTVTLRGGVDQVVWSATLESALLILFAVLIPTVSGLVHNPFVGVGLLTGTVIGFGAVIGSLAVEMGVVDPTTIGYTNNQIDTYKVTANVTPALGFYLLAVGVAGLILVALVRGVAGSRAP